MVLTNFNVLTYFVFDFAAKWPLDERRFNMLLTPYIYMTSAGRRHLMNVKFNGTLDLGGGDGTRPANTSVSSFISSGNLSNPNLTTPDILELEADFSARHATVICFNETYLPYLICWIFMFEE